MIAAASSTRTIPVSAVIPTQDRPAALARAVKSLLASTLAPEEFVVVDASAGRATRDALPSLFDAADGCPRLVLRPASRVGAAAQRNQALALAAHDYVLFCDDDIVCEPDCIERLWRALQSDAGIGGANAMIVNQNFSRPGWLVRTVLRAIGAPEDESYAGRVVGPAIHFLPQDKPGGKPAVPVQWLNTTCTLYRRALLPEPPFDAHFTGYSLREDVALSLRVGRRARLVNVPAARVYHDSQPGPHKDDPVAFSRADLVNRHYVMTEVMERRGWADGARLAIWECCQLAICAIQRRGGSAFWQTLRGRLLGFGDILRKGRASAVK